MKISKIKSMIIVSFVVIVASISVFAVSTGTKPTIAKFDQTLYLEELVSKSILKTSFESKKVTRLEAAELLMRIYVKSKNITIESLPQYNTLSDTNNLYAKTSVLLKILKPNQDKFKPKNIITKVEFVTGLKAVALDNPVFSKNIIKSTSKNKIKVKDIEKLSSGLKSFIKQLVNAKVITLDKKGRFLPNSKLTEKDAFLILRKMDKAFENQKNTSIYHSKSGYKFKSKLINGYKLPVGQSTDLIYSLGSKKEMTIFFSGIFDFSKGLGIQDIHYQVIEAIKSSKIYSQEDLVELLDYMQTKWDTTSQYYVFDTTMYFKDGKRTELKPTKPYILVKPGKFLEVQMSNPGLAK